jgi:trehalose 6-phosphate synthase
MDGALIVNSYDVEGMAEGLQQALHMPANERRSRWRRMYDRLVEYDIARWRDSFLDELGG